MNSRITHNIKHRTYANDEFMTPEKLADNLVTKVPLVKGDSILEPCMGTGAFFGAYPHFVNSESLGSGFLEYNKQVDWIITNPPYSDLDNWLKHCFQIADKGVALLIGLLNITPKRLEMANKAGFGLSQIHICKVFHWFGISAFCIWEKGEQDIITYDRIVWR